MFSVVSVHNGGGMECRVFLLPSACAGLSVQPVTCEKKSILRVADSTGRCPCWVNELILEITLLEGNQVA